MMLIEEKHPIFEAVVKMKEVAFKIMMVIFVQQVRISQMNDTVQQQKQIKKCKIEQDGHLCDYLLRTFVFMCICKWNVNVITVNVRFDIHFGIQSFVQHSKQSNKVIQELKSVVAAIMKLYHSRCI